MALVALLAAAPLQQIRAQSAASPQGTLQLPSHRARPAPSATPQSAPPKAAPVQPVHKVGTQPSKASPGRVGAKREGKPHAAAAKPPPSHGRAPAPVTVPPKQASNAPEAPPDAAAPLDKSAEAPKGSVTGLPLPRFASLRSDEVNLRLGPGTRYPIEWVYKRRDLPVEIEREFDVWRLVLDPEGTKGWVHQATLTGRRSLVVTGGERTLRRGASSEAAAVAKLMPGVVGRIRSCDPGSDWCQVQVGEYRGWLRRDEFWGSFAGEAIQ